MVRLQNVGNAARVPPTTRPPETNPKQPGRTNYDLEFSKPESKGTWTVVVGTAPDISYVYLPASVLEANSTFFARAMKAALSTTLHQLISFPEVKPAVFDLYARWVASGAEIMVDQDDWKIEYAKYTKWQRELDTVLRRKDEPKPLCPVTVWDFGLTTEAWFWGDFIKSKDFQNHCLGHLYYMHLRFDHIDLKNMSSSDEHFETFWLVGTIAYLRIDDLIETWKQTKHLQAKTPFVLEQHPLRRFFVDWLERYWDAYVISDCDYKAQDGIVELIKYCPDLACKQFRNLLSTKKPANGAVGEIGSYWVGADEYPEEVQQRIERYDGTHW
ncbi:hypothetical protein GQ44DRAFT_773495 [Phaeosphaeriaceae sp. PMI808]|nr:hypothetical protein GQ44DRAFT_773495 [Phaeosphaeriaceae sp. PMI808]